MSNVLTTTAPDGTQAQLITQNQQVLDVLVQPDATIGPTGPAGPTGPTGASGGTPFALSNTFFVDGGATGPAGPAQDNGSAINPYATITDALAERGAFPTLALLLTPGTYTENPTYTGAGDFTIETLGDPLNPAIINGTLTAAGANLTLNNVIANSVQGPTAQAFFKGNVSANVVDTGAFVVQGEGAGQTGVVGPVACASFQIAGAVISGDITASAAAGVTNAIEQSSFSGTPTVTVPGADRLFMDLVSLRSARVAGATLTAPVLGCLDALAGSAAIEIAGSAGDITSFDVAFSDCKVGDIIACGCEDLPDDVALASAKCSADGTLTFTFSFSSTVGTTTVNVNFLVYAVAALFD